MNAGLVSLLFAALLIVAYLFMYIANNYFLQGGGGIGFRTFAISLLDLFFGSLSIYIYLFIGAYLSLFSRKPSADLLLSFLITLFAMLLVTFGLSALKNALPITIIPAYYPEGLILLEQYFVIYSIFILLLEAITANEVRNL